MKHIIQLKAELLDMIKFIFTRYMTSKYYTKK